MCRRDCHDRWCACVHVFVCVPCVPDPRAPLDPCRYCQQLVPSCGKNVPPVRLLSDAGLFTGEEP